MIEGLRSGEAMKEFLELLVEVLSVLKLEAWAVSR